MGVWGWGIIIVGSFLVLRSLSDESPAPSVAAANARPLRTTIYAPESYAPAAPAPKEAVDACARIERDVNTLMDSNLTACSAKSTGKGKSATFILLSRDPVFSGDNAAARKLFVVVAVAAAAAEASAIETPIDYIWVTDSDMARRKTGFSIRALDARQLQQRMKSSEIDVHQFYDAVDSKLARISG